MRVAKDSPPADPSMTSITWLIIGCAVIAVLLVRTDNSAAIWQPVVELVVSGGLVLTGALALRFSSRQYSFLHVAVGAVIVAVPFVSDAYSRAALETGSPLELLLLSSLRNLMLVMMVAAEPKRRQPWVVATGVLVMFAVYLLAFDLRTSLIVFLFAALALWWLMVRSWARMQGRAPLPMQREIPMAARVSALVMGVVLLLIGAVALSSGRATTAIEGFMPSSGGSRWTDPYALGGVGDGDQMVSAKSDASSVGPIESDLFLESEQPSIYDVFNDLYQEPVERKKMRSRAIPLSPSDARPNHDKLAENQRVSREFTTIRRDTRRQQRPEHKEELTSEALFYVSGRTPLHLRHQLFNRWDGATLSWEGVLDEAALSLVTWDGKPWLDCGKALEFADDELFSAQPDLHQLRYIRILTPRILSPANLERVHLDHLHTANFFRWSDDGVLRFVDHDVPRLTVLHLSSRAVRRDRLAEQRFRRDDPPSSTLDEPLRALLANWTHNATTDWQRIAAVARGVRCTCQLDPVAVVHDEVDDVVKTFLLEAKVGPDYLFAVSTATLLRHLGYRTRVVSGFYARPDRYLRAARATAVMREDAHFWLEVETEGGRWVTLEPTPGYELLDAPRGFGEAVADVCMSAVRVLAVFKWQGTAITLVVILAWAFRFRLAWMAANIRWRLCSGAPTRTQVLVALAVTEARARLHRRSRPATWTVRHWLESLGGELPTADAAMMGEFIQLCQWALYGGSAIPPSSQDTLQLCNQSVRLLSRAMKRSLS